MTKITTGTNLNNFGIFFGDYKMLEEIQEKSGMSGKYQVEYQSHRWDAIGTIIADGQRLDICIPLLTYNYYQEVSGAAIEFDLKEVSKTSKTLEKEAINKFIELEQTQFFKFLSGMGIANWSLTQMGNQHCHPSGINSFSGTDLRENINHPGVCFPLSTGKNEPIFSGMYQHVKNYAQMIIMEYRIFNGKEETNKHYDKGRCLSLIKGYESPAQVVQEELKPGFLDKLFGTKRPQPPKPPEPKDHPTYVISNGFKDANAEKLKTTIKELMDQWEQCDFSVNTDYIIEKNINRGRGKLQEVSINPWGHKKDYNKSLFPEYATHRNKKENKKLNDPAEDEEPSYLDAIAYLKKRGFTAQDMIELTHQEIIDQYWIEKLDENDEIRDDDAGISNDFSNMEKRMMLIADTIYSAEKAAMLSDKDLNKAFAEIYLTGDY